MNEVTKKNKILKKKEHHQQIKSSQKTNKQKKRIYLPKPSSSHKVLKQQGDYLEEQTHYTIKLFTYGKPRKKDTM